MNKMMSIFKRFQKDESGATAIEYGLIAALMAVVVIGGMTLVGDGLGDAFKSIGDSLSDPRSALTPGTDTNTNS